MDESKLTPAQRKVMATADEVRRLSPDESTSEKRALIAANDAVLARRDGSRKRELEGFPLTSRGIRKYLDSIGWHVNPIVRATRIVRALAERDGFK